MIGGSWPVPGISIGASRTLTKGYLSDVNEAAVSSYFGLWKFNPAVQPAVDPRMALVQSEGFLAQMKAQLESGALKEVHEFVQGGGGYFITGDLTPEKALELVTTWSPWVLFELHQTVKFPKPTEINIEVQKARIAMMK